MEEMKEMSENGCSGGGVELKQMLKRDVRAALLMLLTGSCPSAGRKLQPSAHSR